MRPTSMAWRLGWISLGLLAAAINTGNNLLYLLLGLLIAAVPLCWVGARRNLAVLDVEVRPPQRPRAGSPFLIEVRLKCRAGRRDARGVALSVEGKGARYGPAWIERVPAGQTVNVRFTGRHAQRGRRTITAVHLSSTWPLELFRRARKIESRAGFIVLPAGDPGATGDARTLPQAGLAGLDARVAGQEFAGLQRGSEQDDIRRIDWKTTARRGELVLRETAGESRSRLELRLLTRRSGEPRESRRRFEAEVSRCAAAGQQALERGGEVLLSVSGAVPQTFHGARDSVRFLERLARVIPNGPDGGALPPLSDARPGDDGSFDEAASRATSPGRAHVASSRLALGISLTALLAFDGVSIVTWSVMAISLVLATRFPQRLTPRPGGLMHVIWRVAAVIALVVFLSGLFLQHNPLWSSMRLMVFITLYVTFNSRTARDDRMVVVVSLLHVVLAAALTTEITFAPFLLAWLLSAFHAQLAAAATPPATAEGWRPMRIEPVARGPRYGRTAAELVAAVTVVGLVVYMLMPHLGTGTFSPARGAGRESGFSDRTRLGDIGRIKLDSSPVMEVELQSPVPDGFDLKWRGTAMQEFDGRSWRSDRGQPQYQRPRDRRFGWASRVSSDSVLVQQVRLVPSSAGVLFVAENPETVVSGDFSYLTLDEAGALRGSTNGRRALTYRVESRLMLPDRAELLAIDGSDPTPVRQRNLALPALDSRVPELAGQITAGTDSRFDAVRALEQWLATEREYSLDVQDSGFDDPLVAFLLGEMPGHCEYFATSMVVLARSLDIPSRLVTGYLRGEKNRFSRTYLVRRSDAHAWVEVYFPGHGWVAFDPTPSAGRTIGTDVGLADLISDLHLTIRRWWDEHLIGVDLDDQYQRLVALRGAALQAAGWVRLRLGWFAAAAGLAGLGWIARGRLRARPRSTGGSSPVALPGFYRRLLERLSRSGLARDEAETPAELASRAAAVLPAAQAARVRQLTELYYRVRFDPSTSERQVRRLARSMLAELDA